MHSVGDLIEIALKEDVGSGDITTEYLIGPELEGNGIIIAKEPLVIAGLNVAKQVFEFLDPEVVVTFNCKDGDTLAAGDRIAEVKGKLRALLVGERTALNFLQRLSGIATHVRSFVKALENKNVRLVDTRKTTPGLRVLEKYAVRVGGASNHRMGLYDGILIKDNHIAVAGGIKKAVTRIRRQVSHLLKIEVEVSDLDQVKEALAVGADVIMLDNMTIDQIQAAVKIIDSRALVEVSGRVSLNDLNRLAQTGVDIISVGALTHAARSVDLSMQIAADPKRSADRSGNTP